MPKGERGGKWKESDASSYDYLDPANEIARRHSNGVEFTDSGLRIDQEIADILWSKYGIDARREIVIPDDRYDHVIFEHPSDPTRQYAIEKWRDAVSGYDKAYYDKDTKAVVYLKHFSELSVIVAIGVAPYRKNLDAGSFLKTGIALNYKRAVKYLEGRPTAKRRFRLLVDRD